MATHSSPLAWKIPWTEEPGRLQSMGSLRVGHDWATSLSLFTFMHCIRKSQLTPVFLPGESQGWEPGGLLSMGSHRVGHAWSDLAAAAAASDGIQKQSLKTYISRKVSVIIIIVVAHSLTCVWLLHARLPRPSLSPGPCSNSCPLNQWCHPAISSSVLPFSSCLQSFPASGSFPVSQLFASGGQSTGASASASVLPMNIQDLFSLGLTGLTAL